MFSHCWFTFVITIQCFQGIKIPSCDIVNRAITTRKDAATTISLASRFSMASMVGEWSIWMVMATGGDDARQPGDMAARKKSSDRSSSAARWVDPAKQTERWRWWQRTRWNNPLAAVTTSRLNSTPSIGPSQKQRRSQLLILAIPTSDNIEDGAAGRSPRVAAALLI